MRAVRGHGCFHPSNLLIFLRILRVHSSYLHAKVFSAGLVGVSANGNKIAGVEAYAHFTDGVVDVITLSLSPLSSSHSAGDEVGNRALELMEDSEGQRDVEDDSHETWGDTHVEAADALLTVDLHEAVLEAVVLVRVDALHLRFYNVDGVVGHRRAETGEGAREQVNDDLVGDDVGEGLLGVLEHDETDTLVT